DLLVRSDFHGAGVFVDQAYERHRVGKLVAAEGDGAALGTGVDLLDQRQAAELLDGDDLEKLFDLLRQRPETVDQFGGEAVDVLARLDRGQAAVERHAHVEIGDIGFRDEHRRADVDGGRPLVGDLLRVFAEPHLRHRILEHLLVELDADFADMAGLLFAEQIAGAANVHVVAGDGKSGAELVERLQNLEPAGCGVVQFAIGRRRQIGISALLGATDAPAQLVKLGEAEHVGAMHDHRVRGRNVEAALDDVGGDENVDLALVEGGHDLFEHARRHLAVRDGGLDLGDSDLEELFGLAQVGDARRYIEALTAAI